MPVKGTRAAIADSNRERGLRTLLNLPESQDSRGDLQSGTLCAKGYHLRGDGQRNLATI